MTGFKLESVPKQYRLDQDKAIHPRDTYQNTIASFRRAFPDMELNLKDISQDKGVCVFDFNNGKLNSHGKGATADQAMASAIMEFSERFSWQNFDYKNAPGYRLASYDQLVGRQDTGQAEKVFSPYYSPSKQQLFELIRTIPLHWIQGVSLTRDMEVQYPLNYNNMYQISNGLAAGNTKEEAILQALCEVIERHNTTCFLLNPYSPDIRLVDHASLNNEIIQGILGVYRAKQVDLFVLDLTLDVGIPTIMVYGRDRAPLFSNLRQGFGYGCHTDPIKAIIRALTEYAQAREGIIKNRNDVSDSVKFKDGHWQFKLNIDIEKIVSQAPKVPYTDLPDRTRDDIRDEVLDIVNMLGAKGHEVVYINKTHPRLNIAVCRMFVPGLYPGTILGNVMYENEGIFLSNLYMQAGMREQAARYYEEHFAEILGQFKPIFELSINPMIKHLQQSIKSTNPIIANIIKNLNPDSLIKQMSPAKMPLDVICKDDYLKYITVKTASPMDHIDISQVQKLGALLEKL